MPALTVNVRHSKSATWSVTVKGPGLNDYFQNQPTRSYSDLQPGRFDVSGIGEKQADAVVHLGHDQAVEVDVG